VTHGAVACSKECRIMTTLRDIVVVLELDFGPFTQRSKRYRSMC
jgi:hypothetical protein